MNETKIEENNNQMENEPKEFKFINVPNIEEEKIEEPIEEEQVEEEEIRPGKFFNILEDEEKKPEKEEQIFDFNKMFINPVEEPSQMNNNALFEELNEIENSINNSNTIKPINSESTEPQEKEEPIKIEQPTIEDDDDLDFIEEFEDEELEQKDTKQPEETKNEEIKEQPTIVIPETKITNLKDVIGLIRECSEKIENAGFMIDTEELDLEDMYQVIFKINK